MMTSLDCQVGTPTERSLRGNDPLRLACGHIRELFPDCQLMQEDPTTVPKHVGLGLRKAAAGEPEGKSTSRTPPQPCFSSCLTSSEMGCDLEVEAQQTLYSPECSTCDSPLLFSRQNHCRVPGLWTTGCSRLPPWFPSRSLGTHRKNVLFPVDSDQRPLLWTGCF